MKHAFLLTLLLCTNYAIAAEIKPPLEIESQEVPQTLKIENTSVDLIGAGVRVWGIWPACANLYIAAFYGSNASAFDRDTNGINALKSLAKMPAFAVELQLLSSMATASAMVSAFETALKANGAQESKAIDTFKNMLRTRELGYKSKITLGFINEPDNIKIICTQATYDKVEIPATKEDFESLLSIWLGNAPVDEKLKTSVILGS